MTVSDEDIKNWYTSQTPFFDGEKNIAAGQGVEITEKGINISDSIRMDEEGSWGYGLKGETVNIEEEYIGIEDSFFPSAISYNILSETLEDSRINFTFEIYDTSNFTLNEIQITFLKNGNPEQQYYYYDSLSITESQPFTELLEENDEVMLSIAVDAEGTYSLKYSLNVIETDEEVKNAGFGADGRLKGGGQLGEDSWRFLVDNEGIEVNTTSFKLNKDGSAVFSGGNVTLDEEGVSVRDSEDNLTMRISSEDGLVDREEREIINPEGRFTGQKVLAYDDVSMGSSIEQEIPVNEFIRVPDGCRWRIQITPRTNAILPPIPEGDEAFIEKFDHYFRGVFKVDGNKLTGITWIQGNIFIESIVIEAGFYVEYSDGEENEFPYGEIFWELVEIEDREGVENIPTI